MFLRRQASKYLSPMISPQMYAVCQRMMAPAWLTFHAGGIIKKLKSVPNSSMVAAKGILTTSKLNLSAELFAKRSVSANGPQSAFLLKLNGNLSISPFQSLGSPGGANGRTWERG